MDTSGVFNRALSLDKFRADVMAAEQCIEDIARNLKQQFNDDFVIKRRNALDLIGSRNLKMEMLLQKHGFVSSAPQARRA
jgi:hypothetical protein